MKSHTNLNLIMVSMLLLLHLLACRSSTTLVADQPSQAKGQKQQGIGQSVPDQDRMAQVNRRQRREIGEGIKLHPVDEGPQDRSFEVFRKKLLEAAKRHDSNFILSILDPHILNSLGGSGGVEEFKEQWKLDQPNSKLWNALVTVISMGGSFEVNGGKKKFCAPYVSSRWQSAVSRLPNNSDPVDYAVVTEKNVDVRLGPSLTAPVVATLSYDVVKMDGQGSVFDKTLTDSFTWIKIVTLTGKEGYVSSKYIRSPSDYHACFKKMGEQWIMTMLVAGD